MFEVKLTPEDVDKFVKEAFMKAALGERFTKAIDKSFSDVLDGYDSPLKKIAKEIISERFKELLNTPENKVKIAETVGRVITEKFLVNVIESAVNKVQKEIEDYYS